MPVIYPSHLAWEDKAEKWQKSGRGAADADLPGQISVSKYKEAKVKVKELHGRAVVDRAELYSPEEPPKLGSKTERHGIGGGGSVERSELLEFCN